MPTSWTQRPIFNLCLFQVVLLISPKALLFGCRLRLPRRTLLDQICTTTIAISCVLPLFPCHRNPHSNDILTRTPLALPIIHISTITSLIIVVVSMIVSMIASLTAILIVVVVVMTTTLMAGIDVVRSQLGPDVWCNPHWRRSTTYRMSGDTARNESFTSILWWWYAFCHPTTCIRATVTTNTAYSTTTTIQTTIISDQSGIRMSEENVFSLKVFVHTVIACFVSYPIHRQNY